MDDNSLRRQYNKELKNYVKRHIRKGFDISTIKQKLLKSETDEKTIDYVINSAENEIKRNKKILIFSIAICLLVILSLVTYLWFQKDVLTLENYPSCLNLNTKLERYRCYRGISRETKGTHICGWYFLDYEINHSSYTKKMQEGEIIFSIDNTPVKEYRSKEKIIELFTDKKEEDTADIKTNKGYYNYTYSKGNPDPDYSNLAMVHLLVGQGYCINSLSQIIK